MEDMVDAPYACGGGLQSRRNGYLYVSVLAPEDQVAEEGKQGHDESYDGHPGRASAAPARVTTGVEVARIEERHS